MKKSQKMTAEIFEQIRNNLSRGKGSLPYRIITAEKMVDSIIAAMGNLGGATQEMKDDLHKALMPFFLRAAKKNKICVPLRRGFSIRATPVIQQSTNGRCYIPFVPSLSSQQNKFFLFLPELICLLCTAEKSAKAILQATITYGFERQLSATSALEIFEISSYFFKFTPCCDENLHFQNCFASETKMFQTYGITAYKITGRQTFFSPPTEQRYNTLDFACRKIVCQRRFSPFGYPLVTIAVYIQIEFFCEILPAKIQLHTQKFCKNQIAKFNRHLHFFSARIQQLFIKSKILYASKNEKSPKNFLQFSEKFFGLYYSCEKNFCVFLKKYYTQLLRV